MTIKVSTLLYVILILSLTGFVGFLALEDQTHKSSGGYSPTPVATFMSDEFEGSYMVETNRRFFRIIIVKEGSHYLVTLKNEYKDGINKPDENTVICQKNGDILLNQSGFVKMELTKTAEGKLRFFENFDGTTLLLNKQ